MAYLPDFCFQLSVFRCQLRFSVVVCCEPHAEVRRARGIGYRSELRVTRFFPIYSWLRQNAVALGCQLCTLRKVRMRRVPEVVRRVILKTGFGWILLAWGSVARFSTGTQEVEGESELIQYESRELAKCVCFLF